MGNRREAQGRAELGQACFVRAAGEFTLLIIKEKYFNLFHKRNHEYN